MSMVTSKSVFAVRIHRTTKMSIMFGTAWICWRYVMGFEKKVFDWLHAGRCTLVLISCPQQVDHHHQPWMQKKKKIASQKILARQGPCLERRCCCHPTKILNLSMLMMLLLHWVLSCFWVSRHHQVTLTSLCGSVSCFFCASFSQSHFPLCFSSSCHYQSSMVWQAKEASLGRTRFRVFIQVKRPMETMVVVVEWITPSTSWNLLSNCQRTLQSFEQFEKLYSSIKRSIKSRHEYSSFLHNIFRV